MSFRAFNWLEFKKYVQNKYGKTTAKRVMCYANRYYHVLESGNIGQLNAVPSTNKIRRNQKPNHNLEIHRMLRSNSKPP